MLAGVIQKKTMAELEKALQTVDTTLYDVLELRLDACHDLSIARLRNRTFPLPVLLTLRSCQEGGAYQGSEQERLATLLELMALSPAYLDIEASVDKEYIEALQKVSPQTRLVLSHHNFEKTPEDLSSIVTMMRQKSSTAIYKIATYAHNTIDALRMLVFCKEAKDPILGVCMGEYGETTRILAPVIHGFFNYCPTEDASAPGQLDASFLRSLYRVHKLNKQTDIFGLLGDPVSQSIGHIYHNEKNAEAQQNAVYVKWRVTKKELAESLSLLHKLGVKGLSVTMPLKESLLTLVASQEKSAKISGAVNTLFSNESGWYGLNTDGKGAVRALKMDLTGKRVAILGAGGAAKAIVHACLQHTDDIRVFNRTVGKIMPGRIVTSSLADFSSLEERPYDVLINTLPFDRDILLTKLPFFPRSTVMDISYGTKSSLLEEAGKHDCKCIDGKDMFVEQALLQREIFGQL